MMLAGVPVHAEGVAELANTVRASGADDLADRLEGTVTDGVKLLALTLDERALMLAALEDPPQSSPSYALYCSLITSGGGAKDSTDVASATGSESVAHW